MSNIPPTSNESPSNNASTDGEHRDQTEQAVKALHKRLSKPIFLIGLVITICLIMIDQIFVAWVVFLLGSFAAIICVKIPYNADDVEAHTIDSSFDHSLTDTSNPIGVTNPGSPYNLINLDHNKSHH